MKSTLRSVAVKMAQSAYDNDTTVEKLFGDLDIVSFAASFSDVVSRPVGATRITPELLALAESILTARRRRARTC